MNQPRSENIPRSLPELASGTGDLSVQTMPAPDSSLVEQYGALASHVGLVDRSSLTKLKLVGRDSVDLLQRLSTNDLSTVNSGSSVHTVLTTEKGRVIDLVTLYNLSDVTLILICHAPREKVLSWIEKYIIMEDVSLFDITFAYSLFSLFGPELEKILPVIRLNQPVTKIIDSVVETKVGDSQLTVGGAEPVSRFNVNILVPATDAHTLWRKLVEDGSQAGLEPCSIDALEIRRIEHGFPIYGRELTEEVNPLEAGLEKFVSFTKGCYIGQEVIARLDTYKKLQKKLVGLLLANKADVVPGAPLTARGENVGYVTSIVDSLLLRRRIALAYVRSVWAVPGGEVDTTTTTGIEKAQVVQLPFRK